MLEVCVYWHLSTTLTNPKSGTLTAPSAGLDMEQQEFLVIVGGSTKE